MSIIFGVKLNIGKDGFSFVPLSATTAGADVKPVKPDMEKVRALQAQIVTLRNSSIPIASLPPALRGDNTPTDSLRLITELLNAHSNAYATPEDCIQRLEDGIERRRIEINTIKPTAAHRPDVEMQDYVRALQVCMVLLNRYQGPIDAELSKLASVIVKFQRDHGLKADGIVGIRTFRFIKAELTQLNSTAPQADQQ